MTIENPISTIRKAVQNSAEKMAEIQFLEKPEHIHYKAVLENYRMLKNFNPEMFEKIVSLHANEKEIKDDLGPELNSVFQNVCSEVDKKYQNKITSAIAQLETVKNLNQEELNQEIFKLTDNIIKEMVKKIEGDYRIVTAFSGKNELLKKSLDYLATSHIGLLKILDEYAPK